MLVIFSVGAVFSVVPINFSIGRHPLADRGGVTICLFVSTNELTRQMYIIIHRWSLFYSVIFPVICISLHSQCMKTYFLRISASGWLGHLMTPVCILLMTSISTWLRF